MTQKSEMADLAAIISSYVTRLDTHLSSHNLGSPSFSLNTPSAIPLTPELQMQREKTLAALDDLKALIEGPQGNLISIVHSRAGASIGLQALARYRILDHVKLGQEISFEELSEKCGLDLPTLSRIMRSLTSVRLFSEPRKGFVAHSPASKFLIQHPLAYRWLEFTYEEIWPSTTKAVDAMVKWPASEEPNHTGFSLSRNQTQSFWDTVLVDPVRSSRFSDAMQFLLSSPAFSVEHLFKGLDWEQSNAPEVMVDVGGGVGVVASALLRKFPSIQKVIVQDLPGVVEGAVVPSDLNSRLGFATHDFLKPQPVEADAYLFRLVLHDWSDKYAQVIIRNLIPKLKPGARIIVNDMCLPEPGHLSKHHEKIMREFDIVMKANFNSKERDEDEWMTLFKSCDSRFQSTGIRKSPGSPLAVMEFVWADTNT